MAEVTILVNRPFEIRLDGKGEPLRFPCTILNGESVPREYTVEETLLDHWYLKDLITRGRVQLIGGEDAESHGDNVAIEDMTKAQLVEAVRQAQPDFEPGRMTKAQLVEVLKELTLPDTNSEANESSDAGGEDSQNGSGGPEVPQENQE